MNLKVNDISYNSSSDSFHENLINLLIKLPFINCVINELLTDNSVNWNCQPGGGLSNDNVDAIKLEITTLENCGEFVETLSFDEGINEPAKILNYSLYCWIEKKGAGAWAEPLHDADSLAECELMALLALHSINDQKRQILSLAG